MPYEKTVSRAEPGLIVFILDDSISMSDALPGTSDAKYVWVERYIKAILKELLARCTTVRGDVTVVKPRYFVYFVIYGDEPSITWNPPQSDIQSVLTKYASNQYSLGLGGNLSGTNARAGFEMAFGFLQKAVAQYQTSFPPIIFHLTDGESQTDAEPIAQQIGRLNTCDGNMLVVNAFLGASTQLRYSDPNDFPGYVSESEAGPSDYARRLFRMSSVMPSTIQSNLVADGIFPNIRECSRLFFDVRTKDMLKHVIQVVGSQGKSTRELTAHSDI